MLLLMIMMVVVEEVVVMEEEEEEEEEIARHKPTPRSTTHPAPLQLRYRRLQQRYLRQHTAGDVYLPLQLGQLDLQDADFILPLQELVLAVAHDLLLDVALLVPVRAKKIQDENQSAC